MFSFCTWTKYLELDFYVIFHIDRSCVREFLFANWIANCIFPLAHIHTHIYILNFHSISWFSLHSYEAYFCAIEFQIYTQFGIWCLQSAGDDLHTCRQKKNYLVRAHVFTHQLLEKADKWRSSFQFNKMQDIQMHAEKRAKILYFISIHANRPQALAGINKSKYEYFIIEHIWYLTRINRIECRRCAVVRTDLGHTSLRSSIYLAHTHTHTHSHIWCTLKHKWCLRIPYEYFNSVHVCMGQGLWDRRLSTAPFDSICHFYSNFDSIQYIVVKRKDKHPNKWWHTQYTATSITSFVPVGTQFSKYDNLPQIDTFVWMNKWSIKVRSYLYSRAPMPI